MKIKFIVIDENKLCYVDPRQPHLAPLIGWTNITRNGISGANRSIYSCAEYVDPKTSRLATKNDFDFFNVDLSQYSEKEYEIA